MSELYTSFGGKLEQEVDFTIHRSEELYTEIPIKSPLFRTSYYSIVILRKGRGCYIIDDHSYPTRDNIIYFTNPGHVKGFEIHEQLYGYYITFSESLLSFKRSRSACTTRKGFVPVRSILLMKARRGTR